MFTREELQKVIDKGQTILHDTERYLHHSWITAVSNLVDAADRLDAMIARTEVDSSYSDADINVGEGI